MHEDLGRGAEALTVAGGCPGRTGGDAGSVEEKSGGGALKAATIVTVRETRLGTEGAQSVNRFILLYFACQTSILVFTFCASFAARQTGYFTLIKELSQRTLHNTLSIFGHHSLSARDTVIFISETFGAGMTAIVTDSA